MLWLIVILLVILIGATLEGPQELSRIQSAIERLERSQRETVPYPPSEHFDYPEPELTDELKQKLDEGKQNQLRQRVESECGGWQTGRIVCRRETAEALTCEYVLLTTDRAYTVRGPLEFFHRDGKSHAAQTLQLDAEVRYALPGALGSGPWGLLLAENPEGRILSLQLAQERVSRFVEG
jgi:ribosomal protein L29